MDGQRKLLSYGVTILCLAAAWSGCGLSVDGPTQSGGGKVPVLFRIEDLRTSEVTDTSAVVTWVTTRNAVGTLRLATQPDLSVSRSHSSSLKQAHNLLLEDLTPSTTYYFKVNATAETGETTSADGTPFLTRPPAALSDSTAPVISNIEVVSVTSSSAEIHWETDDLTRGLLSYGSSLTYDHHLQEYEDEPTRFSRLHRMVLTDLTDDTTYEFIIQATNLAHLSATSSPLSFTTLRLPTLGFCPDTTLAQPGVPFDVGICITGVQDLHGIAMRIAYNAAALEILQINAAEFYTLYEGGTGQFFSTIQQPQGRALIEASWGIDFVDDLPVGTQADGDGVICTLRCMLKDGAAGATMAFLEYDDNSDGKIDTRLHDHHRLRIAIRTEIGVIELP